LEDGVGLVEEDVELVADDDTGIEEMDWLRLTDVVEDVEVEGALDDWILILVYGAYYLNLSLTDGAIDVLEDITELLLSVLTGKAVTVLEIAGELEDTDCVGVLVEEVSDPGGAQILPGVRMNAFTPGFADLAPRVTLR
jgi:hypothetical protein